MRDQYITLTKQDPEFQDYLRGTFSSTLMAVPVETFAVNSPKERVTFRVTEKSNLARPSLWLRWFAAIRAELLHFSLGPVLVAWVYVWPFEISPWILALALVSVMFLHAAAFLFNDYSDHIQGIDRRNNRRGSQVIQKGWFSAVEVHRLFLVCILFSLVAGAPIVWLMGHHLEFFGVAALVAVVLFSWRRLKIKRLGAGDLLLFFFFGPLLTLGAGLLVGARDLFALMLFGFLFGALTALYMQIREIESLVVDSEMETGSLISTLGFDRAKAVIMREIFLMVIFVLALKFYLPVLVWALILGLTLGQSVFVFRSLKASASPLSSKLLGLGLRVRLLHLSLAACFIIGFLYL